MHSINMIDVSSLPAHCIFCPQEKMIRTDYSDLITYRCPTSVGTMFHYHFVIINGIVDIANLLYDGIRLRVWKNGYSIWSPPDKYMDVNKPMVNTRLEINLLSKEDVINKIRLLYVFQ